MKDPKHRHDQRDHAAPHDHSGHDHHQQSDVDASADFKVKDPVCGMMVDPHTAEHRASYGGKTWHFCSNGCRTKFTADPEKYVSGKLAVAEEVPPGTMYTCPMHPEVRQLGPGTCSICGMSLEPEMVTTESGPNPELVDMTRRFWVGLVLTRA